VIRNLLSNAFKFTEKGSVKVEVNLAVADWSSEESALALAPSVIALSVIDTGIGVSEENQTRIFEAFAQGDGSTARKYGGTGLGLSIAKELATLLSGELRLERSAATGSTFTIYVPSDLPPAPVVKKGGSGPGQIERRRPVHALIAEGPAPLVEKRGPGPRQIERRRPVEDLVAVDAEPAAPTQPERATSLVDRRNPQRVEDNVFESARVLVVDDDFRNVFAMKALLERGGAVVSFAESGSAALDMLEGKPQMDIVLMDIMMPVMDGYATIRAIRKLDHCKDLPIIAVTGKVMAGERQRCLDAGANDYVPKPVDTGELVAAISPWLPVLVAAVKPWVAPVVSV
jgi:CheY-like chemotaxis protein